MKKQTIISVILIIAAALIGYGLGAQKQTQKTAPVSENGAPVTEETKEPIKIGAILPLTGNVAQYGQESREGIDLALEEINMKGGINGREIKVFYEDSLDDGKGGIDAYRKLNNIDKIKIYLATLSNVSLVVGPLAQKDQNIFFVIGSASPSISQIGDFVFRNNIDTADEAKIMAQFAYNKLGYKQIAILNVNTDAGQIYSEGFKKAFEKLGGQIVYNELYDKTTNDQRIFLTKIKAQNPEAIYIMNRVKGTADTIIQAKELGLSIPFLSGFGIESNELLELVGKELAEGIIFTSSIYSTNSADSLMMQYNQKSENKYNHKAEYFSAIAYDNMQMLSEVMKKCNNPEDTICLKNGLSSIHYKGVTGETSFNEFGDAQKPVMVKTVKNGQFVPYEE